MWFLVIQQTSNPCRELQGKTYIKSLMRLSKSPLLFKFSSANSIESIDVLHAISRQCSQFGLLFKWCSSHSNCDTFQEMEITLFSWHNLFRSRTLLKHTNITKWDYFINANLKHTAGLWSFAFLFAYSISRSRTKILTRIEYPELCIRNSSRILTNQISCHYYQFSLLGA